MTLRVLGWKTEAVLIGRPGADVPKLGDVLQENAHSFVCRKKEFQSFDGLFVPGMAPLDAKDQHVAIDKDCHCSVPSIDAFAADIFKGKSGQICGEARRPCAERFCLLATSQRRGTVRYRGSRLAFEHIFYEAFEG